MNVLSNYYIIVIFWAWLRDGVVLRETSVLESESTLQQRVTMVKNTLKIELKKIPFLLHFFIIAKSLPVVGGA